MNWIGRAWEVFDYAVTAALVGLWRHRFMTGATVLTTALMLLMLNVFVVLVTHLNVALEALEHRVNVIAYIREDAPPGKVRELQSSLQNRSDVLEVIYVTKDEALARLREHFADRAELLAMVADNPLPASLEIRARDPDSLKNIVSLLETKVGPESVLEEVALQEDIVERLLSLTTATRVAGVAMTGGIGGRQPVYRHQHHSHRRVFPPSRDRSDETGGRNGLVCTLALRLRGDALWVVGFTADAADRRPGLRSGRGELLGAPVVLTGRARSTVRHQAGADDDGGRNCTRRCGELHLGAPVPGSVGHDRPA